MPSVTSTPSDFASLVGVLFGDLVDPDALYEVSKMGPEPSEVHAAAPLTPVRVRRRKVVSKRTLTPEERKKRQEVERKVAQVSNLVGLAAGTAGTATAVQGLRSLERGQVGPVTGAVARKLKVKPRTAGRLGAAGAIGATALQAGNVVGDVVTARVLGRSGVEKAIPLPKVVAGRIASMKTTLGIGGKRSAGQGVSRGSGGQHGGGTLATGVSRNPNPTPPTPGVPLGAVPSNAAGPLTGDQRIKMQAAANARGKVEEFVGTTSGKVAIGGVAAAGLYGQGKKKGAEQAYYGKADVSDVEFGGAFSKFDNDKRQAFGWASVVEVNGEPVIDRQGDYIGIDDIEDAAYVYVRKSRVAGDMHRRTDTDEPFQAGELIESVVFTKDKCQSMGLPMSCAGKWWIGVQVDDEDTWQEVKKQARTGFSIHGKGIRKDVAYDELMGSR